MADLLYPQRQRCRKCRRFFAFEVIDRLYCSYACAGLPEPVMGADAPRECRTKARSVVGETMKWRPKRGYWTPEGAQARIKSGKDKTATVYKCGNCRLWHIGHRRDASSA